MMRRKIPKETREQLADDPYMKRCFLAPLWCEGRMQWHHAMTYKGSRIDDIWSILPICEKHHKEEARYEDAQIAVMVKRIKHFGMEEEVRQKYPRSSLIRFLPMSAS